ncbi:MAG: hypothetical protein WAO00_08045 [Chthoniobacterales bacterium]
MASRYRLNATIALSALAVSAFFTGRAIEERTLLVQMRSKRGAALLAPTAIPAPPMPHGQLAVADIFALPFSNFYEALRSAPGDARQKWAGELATMPEGPRRRATISGFYKLLVQFDPAAAAKAIGEIEDEALLRLALSGAVNAAPGFALPKMAELSLRLQDRVHGKRDYLSDVVRDWAAIDAPATARFIDDHEAFEDFRDAGRSFTTRYVISSWAAVDPKAAREWIERTRDWEHSSDTREAFIEGWYENDRAAAVSYTLTNVEDPRMDAAIGAVVCNLYYDSNEEAVKFIEQLPENKRRDAIGHAFYNLILGTEEDTGDTALTPRAVASWMIRFPPAYWKDALGRVFQRNWPGDEEVLSWIQQQPPSIRDAAAAEYSPPFEKSTSESIMPVLQIVDPVLRDQLLRAVVKNRGPNSKEAKAIVTAAPLSSEQKNHLLDIMAAAETEKDQD